MRALAHHEQLEITHINELNCDANTAAHLMQFDTVHGPWKRQAHESEGNLVLDGLRLSTLKLQVPVMSHGKKQMYQLSLSAQGLSERFRHYPIILIGIKSCCAAPVHDETVLTLSWVAMIIFMITRNMTL